jgi:formylglycine-generating enzyme required for sulfatase activity
MNSNNLSPPTGWPRSVLPTTHSGARSNTPTALLMMFLTGVRMRPGIRLPLATLVLTGSTAMAAPPLPVSDLRIQPADTAHVRLSWSPVTQDIAGAPLAGVSYEVHRSGRPWFTPDCTTLARQTADTTALLACRDSLECFRVLVLDAAFPAVDFPDMTLVPAGTFVMGQVGVAEPEHLVTLTRDYLLGTTEVTNRQFVTALNWAYTNGLVGFSGGQVTQHGRVIYDLNLGGLNYHEIRFDSLEQRFFCQALDADWSASYGPVQAYPEGYCPDDFPVCATTWFTAACYCDWLSQMQGLPPSYNGVWYSSNPYAKTGYRLPTEPEWEYAARFSDERTYPWGETPPTCELANRYTSSEYCVGWTSLVGSHPAGANSLGLQDMAGNLVEWCSDGTYAYFSAPQVDPVGPSSTVHMLRGGHFYPSASDVRCAKRSSYGFGDFTTGFRVCRTSGMLEL